MKLSQLFQGLQQYTRNSVNGKESINHKKAKQEFIKFLLTRNRIFDYELFSVLAKELQVDLNNILAPLFSMLNEGYGPLINRIDNRLAFRFYILEEDGSKKRTAANIIELTKSNYSDTEIKQLKDNWQSYKKDLIPNFGRLVGNYLFNLFKEGKEFNEVEFQSLLDDCLHFADRVKDAKFINIYNHFREHFYKSLLAFYEALNKIYNKVLARSFKYNKIVRTNQSLFPGVIYVLLKHLGPFKALEDHITQYLLLKIADLVAVALTENSVVLDKLEGSSKKMRMLRGLVETNNFAEYSNLLCKDLEIGIHDSLELLPKLIKIQTEGLNIQEGDLCITDSTSILSDSRQLAKACKGKNAAGNNYRKQFRLSGVIHQGSKFFIALRLDEGNKVDVNLGNDLLNQLISYVPAKITNALDRGYYGSLQLTNLTTSDMFFAIMTRKNSKEIQRVILENWDKLTEGTAQNPKISRSKRHVIAAHQIEVDALNLTKDEYCRVTENYKVDLNAKLYATIFRVAGDEYFKTQIDYEDQVYRLNQGIDNISKIANKYKDFIRPNQDYDKDIVGSKRYLLDYNKLHDFIKLKTTNCIITNYKTEHPTDVTDLYNQRSFIESVFKSMKSLIDFNTAKVQLDNSLMLKVYVTTLCSSFLLNIASLLEDQQRNKNSYKDIEVYKIIEELINIQGKVEKDINLKDIIHRETSKKQSRDAVELFGIKYNDFVKELDYIYNRSLAIKNTSYEYQVMNN